MSYSAVKFHKYIFSVCFTHVGLPRLNFINGSILVATVIITSLSYLQISCDVENCVIVLNIIYVVYTVLLIQYIYFNSNYHYFQMGKGR